MNTTSGWRRNPQSRMYKVTKVKLNGQKNELNGQKKMKGMLEITADGFKFHLKGRSPLFWPFNSIAEYEYDESMFYFTTENPNGYDGVFKFKTNEAKIIYDYTTEIIGDERCTFD